MPKVLIIASQEATAIEMSTWEDALESAGLKHECVRFSKIDGAGPADYVMVFGLGPDGRVAREYLRGLRARYPGLPMAVATQHMEGSSGKELEAELTRSLAPMAFFNRLGGNEEWDGPPKFFLQS